MDSRGWIEWLAERPKADAFGVFTESREPMIVSGIEIYEVYTVLRRDLSEEAAIAGVEVMRRAEVIRVAESLAIEAADLALAHPSRWPTRSCSPPRGDTALD